MCQYLDSNLWPLGYKLDSIYYSPFKQNDSNILTLTILKNITLFHNMQLWKYI